MLYTPPAKLRVKTRLATEADIPELTRLVDRSVRGLMSRDYTNRQIESALVHLFGVDDQLIYDQTYFVAEMGGQLAGAGGWSFRKDLYGTHADTNTILDWRSEAARIRAMYVSPEFARQGVGSALLRTSEADARKHGYRRVELISTWTGMPLYIANGYRAIEEVSVFLPDGIGLTGMQMGKVLTLED